MNILKKMLWLAIILLSLSALSFAERVDYAVFAKWAFSPYDGHLENTVINEHEEYIQFLGSVPYERPGNSVIVPIPYRPKLDSTGMEAPLITLFGFIGWPCDIDSVVERSGAITVYYRPAPVFDRDYAALYEMPKTNRQVIFHNNTPIPPEENAARPVITVQPQDTVINSGKELVLTVAAESPDGGTLSYQWYRYNGHQSSVEPISGATGTSYSHYPSFPSNPNDPDYYYVYVIVTNTNNVLGGKKTVTARSDDARVYVCELCNPMAQSYSPSALPRAAVPRVSLSGRTLTLSAPANSAYQIRVVDMRGRTAASFNAVGGAKLSLKRIPSGVYVIKAKNAADGRSVTSPVLLR